MTAETPRQLPLQLLPDQDASFDNFYAGEANRGLMSHLRQQLDSRAKTGADIESGTVVRQFTWLSAAPGSGKTHLLHALCHHASDSGLRSAYLPLSEHAQFHPGILEGLESMEVLCLDDIDQLAGMEHWEQALFHLYNRAAQSGSIWFVAAACGPRRLNTDLPDLHSRLQSAAVFHLHALSEEEKMAALQLRADVRGFAISRDVLRYLMARSGRSMDDLLVLLDRLDQRSLETGRRVTVPFVKSLMGW